MRTLFDPPSSHETTPHSSPGDADHPSRWPQRACAVCGALRSAVPGFGVPLLHTTARAVGSRLCPSETHGSRPERDKTMIMDHDIARNDCAAPETQGRRILTSPRARP